MASESGVKPRTILECLAVLGAIYLFFGGQLSGLVDIADVAEQEYGAQPLSQDKIESLVYPDLKLKCTDRQYDVHIFSSSPLVIYIPSFLSEQESEHMVDISEGAWKPSTIFNNGVEESDSTVRKSEKAMIERDSVVQCIEQRALSFQGWPVDTFIERLWTQRYTETGHYALHYDWASASKIARRVSTFMVYVQANCTGGGTNFPLLTRPKDERWCAFVDCDEPVENGVTFLPKAGSAVFWENFDADGRGYQETLHAGMPVRTGVKIGLNIWSWYQRGHQPSLVAPQKSEL
ncbi:hypothetical protein MBLNU459_g3661t1 [Dothideomycetes sp. NU459]